MHSHLAWVDATETAFDPETHEQRIASAAARVNELRQSLRDAVDRSQIHRLAASWYGVNSVDVTPEQFARARLVFSTFSAFAVALGGSVNDHFDLAPRQVRHHCRQLVFFASRPTELYRDISTNDVTRVLSGPSQTQQQGLLNSRPTCF
jgi:hypothetical protein